MARSGGFGTSTNPFGTGQFGGLAQYDIGENTRDLEAYRLEIAWGNGTITDEQYQASLAALAAAATPGTQESMSAYNKAEDVAYRVGRSQAEAGGLDALIAFDQQSLAGMDPGNLRYRDIYDTLNNELAQRRSRDYGVIVDAYNAGQTSTESLVAWVERTLASLPADAPDLDNWAGVRADLADRLLSEKDAQVYQDYQDRKMSGPDFVAYLTGRRDAYDQSSPKWAEADRRLQDAVKNVKDQAQAKIDQDVAFRYAEGKISDNTYLRYLEKRIAGMAPDDPTLAEWKHRLTQTSHSVAEDKLRHEIASATTATGEAKARANLREFYEAYRLTLNPGSAEYRATEEAILSLKPAPVAPTSRGGKGTGGKAAPAPARPTIPPIQPKVIPPTAPFDAIISLLTPNAGSPSKDQKTAVAALRLNLGSAQDAANDKVWLYYDPRFPGQTVTRRNPDGTIWKDPATGKTMQVPGSAYRPTSSDEIAAMQVATASYSYGLASNAAAKGDTKTFWTELWHANNALDAARTTQAHAIQRDITGQLKAIDDGIAVATKLGDAASVVNLLYMAGRAIQAGLADSSLDQAQRDRLEAQAARIEANPLLPVYETDLNGNKVRGPDGRFIQTGGFVNIDASARAADGSLISGAAVTGAGVHYVLDTDSKGRAAWGWVMDTSAPGMWELNHITVQTGAFGRVVTGEVEVRSAPVQPRIVFTDTDGVSRVVEYGGGASYITFIDGHGNRVNGYSIDGGRTWVQATGGILPTLQVNVPLTATTDADGIVTFTDPDGNALFQYNSLTGAWATQVEAAARGGQISWFGQAAAAAGGDTSAGVGAPGQQFRIVRADAGLGGTLSLNLIPNDILIPSRTIMSSAGPSRSTFGGITSRIVPELPLAGPTASTFGGITSRIIPTAPRVTGPTASTFGGITSRIIPSFDLGAAASRLAESVAPTISGIIAIGQTLISAVEPPDTLPPVTGPTPSTYGGITATIIPALKPVVAPKLAPVVTRPPTTTTPKPAAPKPAAPAPAPKPTGPTPSTYGGITARIIPPPPAPAPVKKVGGPTEFD